MSQRIVRSNATRLQRYHTSLWNAPVQPPMTPAKNRARIMQEKAEMRKRTNFKFPANTVEVPQAKCVSVLVTGGIGDFIAVESFLTPEERIQVKDIYLATRAQGGIRSLINSAPIFPNLDKVIVAHDDWETFFCFICKEDMRLKKVEMGLDLDDAALAPSVVDLSIAKVFPQINEGLRSYTSSSLITHTLADISHVELPESFFACCPYSPNDRRMERDFTDRHWAAVIAKAEGEDTSVVVLNVGDDLIPTHPRIVDLSNKTTLPESIEVLKRASGYYGIDSSLSTVATKLFEPSRLKVFSKNPHLHSWKHVYYAPLKTFPFILESL